MTAVLPILFLLIVWSVVAARNGERTDRLAQDRWGEGLLAASVILALAVVASCEILSWFHAVHYAALAIFWTLAILAACAAGWRLGFARPPRPSLAFLSSFGWFERAVLIALVGMAAVLGLIALVAIPTTYDSLNYHLARLGHWEQNRSIAFYPTWIMCQNHHAPLAEWFLLHVKVLSGSFQLVNLLQWGAMIGSVIGVSLIVQRMGGSGRARLLAAVFAATLPMGILQSTSTQNDYVAGFWFVCFVFFGLQSIESATVWRLLLMSASLALALLTKGTMYFFAFPFSIWFGVALLRRMKWSAWQPFLISVALILLVNGGRFTRNYRLYGSPMGPDREIIKGETFVYGNETHAVGAMLSSMARNLALHLGTPLPAWNDLMFRTIAGFHRLLGVDPNDPRTTWPHEQFSVMFFGDENFAGNPLHALALAIALVVFLYDWFRKRCRPSRLLIYLCCLAGSAILFCAVLRWQPWHSRLHLPVFVLASPFFALALADRPFGGALTRAAMAVLALAALPYVVANPSQPVFGSGSVFSRSRKERLAKTYPYNAAYPVLRFAAARGYREIGLIVGGDDWEFPFWLVQEDLFGSRVRFEHVGVTNASHTLAHPSHAPFVVTVGRPPQRSLMVDGRPYVLASEGDWVSGYEAQD